MTATPLSRLCPSCDVGCHQDKCWLCGRPLVSDEYKDRYHLANPAGPNPGSVGQQLNL